MAQVCQSFVRPDEISVNQVLGMKNSIVTLGFTHAVIGRVVRVDPCTPDDTLGWTVTIRTRASQTGLHDSEWSKLRPFMEIYEHPKGCFIVRLTMEYADSDRLVASKKK